MEIKGLYILGFKLNYGTGDKYKEHIRFYYPKDAHTFYGTYEEAIIYRDSKRKSGRKMYELFELTSIDNTNTDDD